MAPSARVPAESKRAAATPCHARAGLRVRTGAQPEVPSRAAVCTASLSDLPPIVIVVALAEKDGMDSQEHTTSADLKEAWKPALTQLT